MTAGTDDPPDNCWTPPSSELAKAVQYPLDRNFAERVVNAYARDALRARTRRKHQ